jgi:6-phosphogluconate dehydrogenase
MADTPYQKGRDFQAGFWIMEGFLRRSSRGEKKMGGKINSNRSCEIGLIGLGVMGKNLVLNIANHGFFVAVYNRTPEKTQEFIEKEAGQQKIQAGYTLQEFIGLLRKPQAILIMVKAGAPVDAVIEEILPLLEVGDLVIDSGNFHFSDTNRRGKSLAGKGLLYKPYNRHFPKI